MTPIVPQRPGRGAPRLASLAGATAMAMVLSACVQTGAQAPIQYAAPGQAYAMGWPTPAPATPAITSTWLGQTAGAAPAGVVGTGVAPFYDQRLASAPVYGPATSYLSDVAYGVQAPAYAGPTYAGLGYSGVGGYVQPSVPTSTVYADPTLTYAAPPATYAAAPAPIHDPLPAPAPSYNYAYGATAGLGGVTLYDGRLPAAPVYGPGSSYVASASMAPIYDPQDHVFTGQSYAAAPAPVYAAPTPAPTYVASAPPIHDPWPVQGQSYGQSAPVFNATPYSYAYAPAPQTSYPSYAPNYAPISAPSYSNLGVAPNAYVSTYSRGDVLFRVTEADLRGGGRQIAVQAPSHQAQAPAPSYPTYTPAPPTTLGFGGAPVQFANVPANPAPIGQSLGSFQGSWGLGLDAAPAPTTYEQPNYQPPTNYVQPYAPPSNLSRPYPRPYPVSGAGIYPSTPMPTGVASARVLDYGPAPQPAWVFEPGTPIYADQRNQRYIREIVRLPQSQPGLWTDAASLRAGALVPASSGPAYLVSSGDTLYRIARTHGVSVESLAAANGLTLNAVIHPGQPLYIPRGGIGPMVPVYETFAQGPQVLPAQGRIETGSTRAVPASVASGLGPRAASPDFVWPLRGPLTARRDAYGVTSVEVKGAPGAPVRAAAAGEAIHVENGPQGVMVVLDHGGGWTSIHVGLAEVGLKVGQRVNPGDLLGVLAARPEAGLVFELRRNNLPVDPTDRMRG
ncbi:LysM peptidoglycan-binding domain-containing protein [Neomegalonema sp.]|uniref:LysM peptidoglycan-binding domain-containing protein n=1 Tax=Neomegalonema sp. TaxID=2039713 RepID=UPI002613A6EC|nr:LysM peptidoglycan-binding domain-containing protein [Neomegalonema sp.]MDD2867074.1 peptidoglycan DD-metalloendopeptidase family protein [Neomegalonema sp.]